MQVLDRTGVGTLWSICKTKFALKDHSHNYLPLSGGTLTGDLLFSNSGTTFRQIRGTCGDNDFWRIGGGATGNNAGYMEIATADDGTEPIYVRQYSGTFSTITRTATLLDGSGNTSFPGTVAAAKFKGALEGNASTASNASTVNGHTVNANVPSNAKFTDTNTWRPIQDNLISTSTSESLSANQGRVLKGLIDGKANSSHTHSWSQISGAPATATRWPSWGEVTSKPDLKSWSEIKNYIDSKIVFDPQMFTIKGLLQRQFDQLGLKVGVYTGVDHIDQYDNILVDSLWKYIGLHGNYTILDVSKNSIVDGKRYETYSNQVLYKYYIRANQEYDSQTQVSNYTLEFKDGLGNIVKTIKFTGYYACSISAFNKVYIVHVKYDHPTWQTKWITQVNIIILNNNLDIIKTLQYDNDFKISSISPYNLGDNGLFLCQDYDGPNCLICKNDTIIKQPKPAKMNYTINGNSYEYSDLGELITDTMTLNIGGYTIKKDGSNYYCVCKIKDLSKNIDHEIIVPEDIYSRIKYWYAHDTYYYFYGGPKFKKTFITITPRDKETFGIRVYKE